MSGTGGAPPSRSVVGGLVVVMLRIGSVSDEERHRLDVRAIRRAPEGGRTHFFDVGEIEVVAGVPHLPIDARVRIRTLVEECLHEAEIVRLLIEMRPRIGIARLLDPAEIDHGVERRHAVVRRAIGVGAAIEQHLREIELPVDARDQERRRTRRRPSPG